MRRHRSGGIAFAFLFLSRLCSAVFFRGERRSRIVSAKAANRTLASPKPASATLVPVHRKFDAFASDVDKDCVPSCVRVRHGAFDCGTDRRHAGSL
jgi:hypothetical protein